MHYQELGAAGPVSRICLGGGGIGGVWGEVSRDEAVLTLRHAVDSGVTLLDTSPGYGFCEEVVARAFDGRLDPGVRVTTKIWVNPASTASIFDASKQVIVDSLRAMRVERIDIFFLHNGIIASEAEREQRPNGLVLLDRFTEEVVPAFEALAREGLIGHWGITAGSASLAVLEAINHQPRPAVAQVPTNLLDSGGDMSPGDTATSHRAVAAEANRLGIGVMGVRVLQAGALAPSIDRPVEDDHPTARDHVRARRFLDWCRANGDDPVEMAHRYALAIPGVATLISGAKSRAELNVALAADRRGPLTPEEMRGIDTLAGQPERSTA